MKVAASESNDSDAAIRGSLVNDWQSKHSSALLGQQSLQPPLEVQWLQKIEDELEMSEAGVSGWWMREQCFGQ